MSCIGQAKADSTPDGIRWAAKRSEAHRKPRRILSRRSPSWVGRIQVHSKLLKDIPPCQIASIVSGETKKRAVLYSLTATVLILSPDAAWAAHGKPRLWNITSTMSMPNMPGIPPEALSMIKAHHKNAHPTNRQPDLHDGGRGQCGQADYV
jgi:hypothetical protein